MLDSVLTKFHQFTKLFLFLKIGKHTNNIMLRWLLHRAPRINMCPVRVGTDAIIQGAEEEAVLPGLQWHELPGRQKPNYGPVS